MRKGTQTHGRKSRVCEFRFDQDGNVENVLAMENMTRIIWFLAVLGVMHQITENALKTGKKFGSFFFGIMAITELL